MKFLEDILELLKLYCFLVFDCFGFVDVYCVFVLLYFSIFSKEVRQIYFEYIKDKLLLSLLENNEDKWKLLEILKIIVVIIMYIGMLIKVLIFYDLENKVFKVMFVEYMFLFVLLNLKVWLKFLRKIGLRY